MNGILVFMTDNTGRDRTEGTVEDGEQVAVGRGNRQQNMRAGDVHVGGAGEFPAWKLTEMSSDIRALVAQNLPNRVERLERLEVVVRPGPPPEVIVRPLAHDTVNLSVRMIAIIFLVALVAVLALVAWLVFLQVANV